MGLKRYNEKRKFDETPEPEGMERSTGGKELHFVVQKHNATRLHYDFRLEIDGVLKSWAIPKGPSLNPRDKRLAMHVEDHPLEYRKFEGKIPEGSYGAGDVIIWDEGTCSAPGAKNREESERILREGFESGSIDFVLNGKRLKGEFHLRKFNSSKKNTWLLIKRKDRFASDEDITQEETSVLSGHTLSTLSNTRKGLLKGTSERKPESIRAGKKAEGSAEEDISTGKGKLILTNTDKVYWPEEGYTKGDLINYYKSVSEYMLPYLKDRPHTLLRHPDGIKGESFFQKHMGNTVPEWIKTIKVAPESGRKEIDYLVCTNEESLLYMVNLGCIEINPWFSKVKKLRYPDFMVIDLDPLEVSFDTVVETALAVREVIADEAKAKCYCKTSGATGLHIYIPLNSKYEFEVSKEFAHLIARVVHEKLPGTTSLERSPDKRKGKVYLDYLQNKTGATVAAPYSVRPGPGAPVSTPLSWDEVKRGLDPMEFTIKTAHKRLKKLGDIFMPVLGQEINIVKCINNLEAAERLER
ncbi:MAG: non-homologous end-joining DNA ligase [Syntrophomonadaceae bacterium]